MPGAASSRNSMVLPILRSPTLAVVANGVPLPGAMAAEVTSGAAFTAARFTVDLALAVTGAGFWSGAGDIYLDVQIGLDGVYQSVVQGLADTLQIDPIAATVRLEGRDLTASFIEARTQETFANRTSSEIATLLAGRHGMTASVTDTTTPVGRYYELEHDTITLNQFARATTEWDLLAFLAQREGFALYVDGTVLHFEAPSVSTAPLLSITPQDVIDLRLERALTLSRDVEVAVKSWNARHQAAFVETARGTGAVSSSAVRGGLPPVPAGRQRALQSYVYVRPNLTPDQALQMAQNMLAELSQHERTVVFTMPGDLLLTPRSPVGLSGTGTDFDGIYHVAAIDRHLTVTGGYVQTVHARSLPPAGQATPPASQF